MNWGFTSDVPETNPIIEQKPLGGIPVGGNVTLTCTMPGGNPLAILSWNCTGISKNETVENTASYSIAFTINKSFNNKICACTADHKIYAYKTTVQHNLVVYYAPSDLPSIQQTPPGGIITSHIVILTCSVKGGNPLSILRWNCTGDTTNSTTDTTATYSISFPVNKSHNKAICACSASHPDTSYTHVIEHNLDVYYEPGTNPIISQIPHGGILTGNNIKLTCTVTGGNPLAILSWNCSGTIENNTVENTASYSIILSVNKSYNNKICTCTARHLISTYKPTVQQNLVVYYAPDDRLNIKQTPPGGIITSHIVILTCSVKGGNPLSILRWNCTGDTTNSTTDTTATYSVSFPVNKSHNKAICACSASHPDTSYKHVIEHNLDVYFAPDTNLTIQRTPAGAIISGNKVNLTCIASGGNPPATLSWNCSGTNTNYTTENTVSHSVEFEVDKRDNNKLCTCSATHPVTSYRQTVENRLFVYFKPFLDTTKSNSPANIDISENDHLFITVSVKSNPHPIIKWTFIAQENIDCCNNSVINSTSINVGLHSSSNISIDNLKKNQFGQYTFMATNVVGIFLRKFSVLGKGMYNVFCLLN
ncbi:unnamed protein product [Mytilus coruscus]|uniref:Ig-like domain-containing protein n=1 Tax=Mytilus coruscus TaxID=42192 RepID=A0A6J8ATN9_MYTCO|nr:unnamed protein product [Mytilus coruscus]